RKLFRAICPALKPVMPLNVRPLVKVAAQVEPASTTGAEAPGAPLQRHATGAAPFAASALMIACWLLNESVCGRKIFVLVSSGTEFCASCRKPSNPRNRNVRSFLIGAPMLPPNCSRDSVSLILVPVESAAAGLNPAPGANAWLKANG